MEREAADEASPALGSTQSSGQPSHICHACLSVLTRDGLELMIVYRHHRDSKSFVEAAHAGCHICSPLLSSLPSDEQRGLEKLAEGKIPYELATPKRDKISCEDSGPGDSTSPIQVRSARDGRGYYDQGSSVTKMWLRMSSRDSNYKQICIKLSPFGEVDFPPHMTVYRSRLRDMWGNLSHYLIARQETPLLVDGRGIQILPLIIRYQLWLMKYSVHRNGILAEPVFEH